MDIKIKPVDEMETKIEFVDSILISSATLEDFMKELNEVIEKYAI